MSLKRKTPLRRTGGPRRTGRLPSRGPKAKRDAKHDRNFGEEADRVRAMEYCVCSEIVRDCFGPIVAAHDPSRGAGGGRMNLYNACVRHHDEQHSIGIGSFRAKYGLDTIAIGDAIALGHPDGLGIRGLAAGFARVHQHGWRCQVGDPDCGPVACFGSYEDADSEGFACSVHCGHGNEDGWCSPVQLLEGYDLDALLGWVRRYVEAAMSEGLSLVDSAENLAIELNLGDGDEFDEASAHAMVDAAGCTS